MPGVTQRPADWRQMDAAARTLAGFRVLVVDDDADILRVLRLAFEAGGHAVVTESDPLRVARVVAGAAFDAIVLDLMMPGRTGFEVLAELRADAGYAAVPILMLSSVGQTETRVRGIRLGADDFLAKPFDVDEVVARVEGLVARRGGLGKAFFGALETSTAADEPASRSASIPPASAAPPSLAHDAGAEIPYPEGWLLVSHSDVHGVITNVNDCLCAMSGYTRQELLGQPHSIFRHPDMPREVFLSLWETIAKGFTWHGYVKDRCRDGRHYWSYMTVIPTLRDGEIVGYTAVRREPSRAQVVETRKYYGSLIGAPAARLATAARSRR